MATPTLQRLAKFRTMTEHSIYEFPEIFRIVQLEQKGEVEEETEFLKRCGRAISSGRCAAPWKLRAALRLTGTGSPARGFMWRGSIARRR